MEFQMLSKQAKLGEQQLESIDEELTSMARLIDDLESLKSQPAGTEILTPVGNGIFLKANLSEPDSVVINVGSGVALPKGIDDAREMLRKKIGQGKMHRMQMFEQLQEIMQTIAQAETELSTMIE